MYTEDILRGPVIERLSADLSQFFTPLADPMPCDRWLARSLLHKACRRGETVLAWRALAALFEQHPAGIWRSLTIITMEDIGMGGIPVLANIVIASRDRRWRRTVGGDWKVAAFLVMQMCEADHDQSVCDLLHHAQDDPALNEFRADALEAEMDQLAKDFSDGGQPLLHQGVLALAIGGGAAEGQQHNDAGAVFHLFEEMEGCRQAADLCRAAWRITRHEMAFMLPLIWRQWTAADQHEVRDDLTTPVAMIGELPEYAVDQFTRSGIQLARRLLAADPVLKAILDKAAIPRAIQHRTVGDLIFLIEGSALTRRIVWPTGDALRLPHRCLADTLPLMSGVTPAISHLAAKRALITDLRVSLLSPMLSRFSDNARN